IAACIFGFCMAFGIGANDVANAFATSVSAKSVSLKQAVIIASICEFLGAMLLGASVTSTIKGKMIDADLYEDTPDVLMYGMLTSLVSASFILMVANYLSLPVSTTHTIVGSIIGFSIAAKGFESIKWKEVGKIIISWVASPALTGTMAIIFFYCTRRFILQSENPYQRSVNLYPVIIFLAIGLDLFMVFAKAGSNNDKIDEWGLKFSLPCAFGVSLFLGVVASLFIVPNLIEPRVIAKIEAKEAAEKKAEDIGQKVLDDEEATEEMFSYLQVLTACLLSFAHGANDVANAIAPIAAVYAIYETGEVSSKVPVQKWIIFLGAAGIVVGLALYGYNLIVSLGYKITKLSPSRGFCIELSASTIVVIASYLGIPVSTTQCQVGGTMGVGL
ncbi:inorganic phosphate transporter, partial [Thalassiosira pseudonana CCMP1335]